MNYYLEDGSQWVIWVGKSVWVYLEEFLQKLDLGQETQGQA